MDDPPALRYPGDTGDPIDDRGRIGAGGSDTVDDNEWRDPAARPNPQDANDVSVPVMTMSVLPNIGVERTRMRTSRFGRARRVPTSTTCSAPIRPARARPDRGLR